MESAGVGSGVPAAVVTVSDRAASGARDDRSGPLAVELLRAAGCLVGDPIVVHDGEGAVAHALRTALAGGARLVVTTGGTGIGPRDRTPEGTRPILEQELPGIGEELRRAPAPGALLSRGLAGVATGSAGRALVVNLPGSTGAVRDGVAVIARFLSHAIAQLDGADHA